MLFNSYIFLLCFLPLSLLLVNLARRYCSLQVTLSALVVCSLFFYGYWNPVYLLLLVPSLIANYLLGGCIQRSSQRNYAKYWMLLGVILNLGLLGYFKYRNFFLSIGNDLLNTEMTVVPLILPLAISFFTFQQIAYLVDVYQAKVTPGRLANYSVFVVFFPQLIAGPIVHYNTINRQISAPAWRQFDVDLFAKGLMLFSIGLFKKVVIADNLALFVNPIYEQAQAGQVVSSLDSVIAMFGYSFQLYFDFSGYADMALGLAAMFGIRLPVNFAAPYRAASIIDFWQRWHMTLSQFLRDYLYIPLGGNRHGKYRQYGNLLITMLLGGLWHGAGWTFLLWGGIHGGLLVLNHLWRRCNSHWQISLNRPLCVLVTFTLVSLAWVLFRAESFGAAQNIYYGLFHPQGVVTGLKHAFELLSVSSILSLHTASAYLWLVAAALICLALPTSQQFVGYQKEGAKEGAIYGRAALCGVLLFIAINRMSAMPVSEFLYFNF